VRAGLVGLCVVMALGCSGFMEEMEREGGAAVFDTMIDEAADLKGDKAVSKLKEFLEQGKVAAEDGKLTLIETTKVKEQFDKLASDGKAEPDEVKAVKKEIDKGIKGD
jgi:hypothetical protein